MSSNDMDARSQLERLEPDQIRSLQLARLNELIRRILPSNRFYQEKLQGIAAPFDSLEELAFLPYTTKSELADPRFAPYAANRTYEVDHYCRFHRTSGTRGRPLIVLDDLDDWNWWKSTWQFVLDSAKITAHDRVLLAFSFGPFIGFWTAHDALSARGAMTIPGGGMDTMARISLLRESQATAVCCTPTYALRMAEVAEDEGMSLTDTTVTRLIVAGEPGGSQPKMRNRIETDWNATVIDHAGATEVGPWGYADQDRRGLHVIESEFIAEFIDPDTEKPVSEGDIAELVLTSLGRFGAPVIRYRTGDLVRPSWNAYSKNRFVFLDGGVLGRADDMMVIRGMNVFPSSVEEILRGFPEVVEYRITARKVKQLDELRLEVEDRLGEPGRIKRELELQLGLRIDVQTVPLGTLPRFEVKGRRFIDERNK